MPPHIGTAFEIDDFWNGRIDDVRIYNVALTDAEVASLAAGN